uniref:Leucine rich pentatricopeptide repeat containing n=1 Tax=Sinocyclocheilus grahami TaxID=75366 RepID=A0A672KZ30_SINGR
MAALLRSARPLKCSPAALLQVFGNSRHVSAASRLYSEAVGTTRAGLCVQTVPGRLNYGVVPEQRGLVKDEPSVAVRSKQAQQFDWALVKLDSSVRRTGRVTKTLLLRIFHDICRTGYPSGNQALLLLRSCGSLLPEVPLAERVELSQQIWDKLQELGTTYDVSHYNALLKTYLQNEFRFSPTDFLAKMESANVQPNRVTYQRLIAAYCEVGDIEGASTILGFMKSKDLPITEAVFNSLVTGHARAGDMDSAEGILSVMKGSGIEPGPDTYLSLLNVYAEKGDISQIKQTLETVENADILLMDRDLMQVVFSLTKASHQQHVPEIVERMRHERGYVPDAMNLCLSLITHGHEETAFSVLKSFTGLLVESQTSDSPDLGNFFLRHCANMDKPVENIVGFCKDLKDSGLHSSPLQFTLQCALEAKKTGMAVELMRSMKEEGLPLRPHYFCPLFTHYQKDKNIPGTLQALRAMQELGVASDVDTFSIYILPSFPSVDSALKSAATCLCQHNTHKRFKSLFAGLQYFYCSGPTEAPFVYSYDSINVFIESRKCQIGSSLLFAENVAYFLYNLIDSLNETEVHSKEEQIREYFGLLKNMVRWQTLKHSVVNRSVCLKYLYVYIFLTKSALHELSCVSQMNSCFCSGLEGKLSFLEKTLAELKAEGKPASSTLKKVITVLCSEERLERALELKTQYETDMTPAAYATLINLCCRHDNAEEALKLKMELARRDSEAALDAQKYVALVRVLSKHGKLEEAIDMLKEMKEKDVQLRDSAIGLLTLTMNTAAMKGDANTIRCLQETVFTLGLAKPSSNLCSPLISFFWGFFLVGTIKCFLNYPILPKLSKHKKYVCDLHQFNLLKSHTFLFFTHVQTPGLRARPTRLQWFAEKCIAAQQMEPLENMVDMTVKLFECDRDDMYHYLLRLCKETNDWQKAEATWMKMQKENLAPRERTLRLLADILKNNDKEVPFEVPEANDILKEADSMGMVLSPAPYDTVIKTLLASGNIEDAMAVKNIATDHIPGFSLSDNANNLLIISQVKRCQMKDAMGTLKGMLQADQVPTQLAITRLVQGLANEGNSQDIQEVEALVKTLGSIKLSSMLFVNNTALAHIKNEDIDSAVELLESFYIQNTENQKSSIYFVFRKVLDANNDAVLDKLSAMAERLCNHFASYRAATDLFLIYLDTGRTEEAKFLLQVPSLSNQDMHEYSVTTLPDMCRMKYCMFSPSLSTGLDKDFSSAKALYERMQAEGVKADELTLKRLALLYKEAGATVPFDEPPESFRFYADRLNKQRSESIEPADN